jgi:hypothetical protein
MSATGTLALTLVIGAIFFGAIEWYHAKNPCIMTTSSVVSVGANPNPVGTSSYRENNAYIITYHRNGHTWTEYTTVEKANSMKPGQQVEHRLCNGDANE